MTTQSTLGQRLREWRLAKSWSIADVAAELSLPSVLIAVVERDSLGSDHVIKAIEALINPGHEAIVEAAVAAIRAGLEQGATSVHIIRPETPTTGRVTVILGDDNDLDWRKEL